MDWLSKAKNDGNADAMLLSAYFWQRELDDPDYDEFGFDKDFGMLDYSDEFKEKKNEEILHDLQTSAKGGNDIAAYRYWMACFSELWWDDSALEDNPSFYTRNTCTEAFDCLKSASDNYTTEKTFGPSKADASKADSIMDEIERLTARESDLKRSLDSTKRTISTLEPWGNFTKDNFGKLEEAGYTNVSIIKGGISSLYGKSDIVYESAVMSLERQVRIVAGAIVLLGSILALIANAAFAVIPAFVGCGLIYAGISNTCAMASLLKKLLLTKGIVPFS